MGEQQIDGEQILVAEGHDKSTAAMLIAALLGLGVGMKAPLPMLGLMGRAATARKAREPFPMMVTASRVEIAAWNAAVTARKKSKRLGRLERQYERAAIRAIGVRQYKKDFRANRRAEAA